MYYLFYRMKLQAFQKNFSYKLLKMHGLIFFGIQAAGHSLSLVGRQYPLLVLQVKNAITVPSLSCTVHSWSYSIHS